MSDEQSQIEAEAPRKATEILLSIESKIDTLSKVMYSYDLNSKITLNRVNEIHSFVKDIFSYIDGLKQEYVEQKNQEDFSAPDTKIVEIPADVPVSAAEQPIVRGRVDRIDTARRDNIQPVATEQASSNKDKKIPVVQRITDQNGKDLFMAEVCIFNTAGEQVLKTKTSAVGKWQALLKPGKYIVDIVKTDTSTKTRLEAKQEITITDSNSTITLPAAIIKR